MVNAYLIFRPALGEVMDEHLHDDMVEDVRQLSLEIEGVVDTEKCNIRKSGMQYFIDLHLLVDGTISVENGHDIAHKVKDHLMRQRKEIVNILIHVEPYSIS
jgi:divalent metal cation (Fe/Co/Zn/Cd) transporter